MRSFLRSFPGWFAFQLLEFAVLLAIAKTLLALVGLPIEPGDVELPPIPSAAELRAFGRPVLLAAGEGDVYAPRPRLESLSKQLPACELLVLPGTDHFLWRREREAATAVAWFAVRALGLDQSSPER